MSTELELSSDFYKIALKSANEIQRLFLDTFYRFPEHEADMAAIKAAFGYNAINITGGALGKKIKTKYPEAHIIDKDSDVILIRDKGRKLWKLRPAVAEAMESESLGWVSKDQSETPEELVARTEGKEVLRSHLHHERLSYFRDQKLRMSLKPYRCEACEMSFVERYGSIGSDFIEVHHKSAVAGGERETRMEDLALLCSNCHRMIHKTDDLSDVRAFKNKYLKQV